MWHDDTKTVSRLNENNFFCFVMSFPLMMLFSCKLTMTSSFFGSSLFFYISLLITSLFVFFYSVCLFFSPLFSTFVFSISCLLFFAWWHDKNPIFRKLKLCKVMKPFSELQYKSLSIQLTTNKGNLIVFVFVELSLV